ncbi:MAG TPA: universal stress protein [Polyangiaceae bacterium]|nr:universal stress protein [Polyangiaceae bacterium]
MIPFGNILVAVDFSPPSIHALQVARELARASGARLLLLHVQEPIACADPMLRGASPMDIFGLATLGAVPPALDAEPRWDARLVALQAELAEDARVRVETRLGSGSAAAQIIDVAFDEGTDLIVMGTHGRTGLGRWLMGSVAETVVRHARCPVLTLRLPEEEGDDRRRLEPQGSTARPC